MSANARSGPNPSPLFDHLAYRFSDLKVLHTALRHRSVGPPHNERLEFLGDAILGSVISARLFADASRAAESQLSLYRAQLVRRESLAAVAREIELGSFLILGRNELNNGVAQRDSVLADAMEALIGAVFIDGGFSAATQVVERLFGQRVSDALQAKAERDPKSRLQEWLQARGWDLPEYQTIENPDARPRYRVDCSVARADLTTRGTGADQRSAQQAAAEAMLAQLEA